MAYLLLRRTLTRGVKSLARTDVIQAAAQAMDDLNVGAIPICEDGRVVGIVTDRDIVVRGVAAALPAESTTFEEVMSESIEAVHEDDALEDVLSKFSSLQIRRVPVLDNQEQLVGILSLGDIAAKAGGDASTGDTLAQISDPAEPDRATGQGDVGPASS